MLVNKLAVIAIATIGTLSSCEVNAFSLVSSAVGTSRPAAAHYATIEETTATTTSSLISPSDIEGSTEDLFENFVQKTYGRYPLTIVSGEGCVLKDDKGKTYLDFVSGIATCALGHANPELTKAISEQMGQLHHISNLYFNPQQAKLAAWLSTNSVADKVFFCNSGAEANEAAIKLARKHASTERGITDPVIITAHQSFHGRTLAAISATGQPKYHEGFTYGGEMVPGFAYVDYNDKEALTKLVNELSETPAEHEAKGRKRGVAAIMLEPLQGEGGIIAGDPDFFARAREICDETGALLISDEVQIGMGRSGKLWGYENLQIEPDVFTSAKALGGGVPIGAMCCKESANAFGPGDHASTYGGNPLACQAGLTVAQYLSDHDILTNVVARGEQISKGLEKLAEKYPNILDDVRGWGLLKGIKVKDDAGVTAGEVVGEAMKEGLLLVPAGPSVVRFVPPLIVSEKQIDEALEIFERALNNMVTKSS
uniref:acetylornithine transaminase n=1 Tax=Eucampia antarctica TaxID=49252 RepID=A0A7S2R4J0_9STRA|mmetsp:Transcript_16566/g.15987  ORF Transcript_16566/g.15987 Transcript_16566/m.15987 type:complete len:484 (+) Transcript_16566:2-1453(+)|eukprot:CAMPEP_0197825552 /NCGR_PEP_ID=MMETSP1437-20131217/2600_1 /TAXON_ID=49252 ORGANISM="Eucampia antarctica, Strain CCMP1452" /NCGR_SAMPLE_ID=MMETSP1437 /ASSEMBLY_ACC=CAM_ASM_001096 /LENGTH=483 /DNA_ID=CAMNT_0043425579 /DNA_START=41 /DNA_END=1492 /DNA_ORIENTATION=-